ncbi:putative clathrin assembly protein At2g25430 [Lycium barbarum]|uniref:putative clathrin assembly protein At2g25430 n=1 Tax=Lycium barbarum TaxID=112863 RepID=UPI00293E7FB6|nr:putative clathrin assembly protein At2g25430 [Lycium barbarum]XP_060172060.1 putative clathrin assembly protein At2g25430 [Lycium barbarum]XP_060172061.1 putative clathrin assembly protein At2g25430 [Lycium barbarum]XP_060172062.1 putative clathrin assembly protein At2g25430 [Lycium barbarum]XP_060172063.1 putative clathrin assembly protein At2g25430 [Lycium barbarum]
MAPSIRKAIGAVKDQTSISLAKVNGNVAPDLEVLVVKATTHDNDPADEKYIREILYLTSNSRGYVSAFVFAVSKRLSKTHDWVVALKALMLVHRLLTDGDPVLGQEIMYASRRGMRILNMSDFRDEAHSNSWDHSGFIRTYAVYLDRKLEFTVYDRKMNDVDEKKRFEDGYGNDREEKKRFGDGYGNDREEKNGVTPVREMKPERVLERLNQLLQLLDRFLACRPTGAAKNSRMVLVALYSLVKESFTFYADICEVLQILLDRFGEMEYADCVKAFDAYVSAAKMIDELVGTYNWCKDIGIARSSEFPEVQVITDKLLGTLEGFLRERANRPRSPEINRVESSSAVKEEKTPDMNEIKALPPPENYSPPPPPPPQPVPQPKPHTQQVTEDLVNLKDDGVTADGEGNKMALALFSGPVAKGNGSWEAFPSDGETGQVTSAWQTPAAEIGKADWELALVETASNLSKQTADLAGGFDSLLLNGMYDQGTVRQHVSHTQETGGSASSVALPGVGKSAKPMLALPAPDGTVQPVGNQDPFAASLAVPPPSYVQMAEQERKQHLLMQEQQLWQQYASNGMQGQMGLSRLAGTTGYYGAGMQPSMPYGMPQGAGMGQSAGYYFTPL